MKTITKSIRVFHILCITCLLLFSADSFASHFRYMTVNWEIVSTGPGGTVVEFNVTQSWRSSFNYSSRPGAPGGPVTAVGQQKYTGNFQFGDGAQIPLILNVNSINVAEDWFVANATFTHTYQGSIDRLARFDSCCRLSDLVSPNDDDPYRVRTLVTLSDLTNNSPVANTPPVFFVPINQVSNVQLSAFDPDGDAISFSYSSSSESGLTQPIPTTPNGPATLSPSGVFSINTNGLPVGNRYATQVKVTDARGATIPLDFVVETVGVSTPPVFVTPPTPANATLINVGQGNTATFDLQATDADPGSSVSIFATGLPSGAILTDTPGNPANASFSWTPTGSDLGAYVIAFTAQDDLFAQANTSVTINVVPCSIDADAVPSDVSCPGGSDGSIDLTLSGNFGNASYDWTGPNGFSANTEDLNNVEAGSYTVTATGDFGLGCSVTKTYNVGTTPDTIAPTITCPSDISVNSDPGQCGSDVLIPSINLDDNCGLICSVEDIDEYSAGNIVGQGSLWVPWDENSSSALVSTEQFVSAPNSLKVEGGGTVDQLLLLGNQTSGKWVINFKMFIPSGSSGYYNLQQDETPAIQWQHQLYFNADGTASFQRNGLNTGFTYPQNVWFDINFEVDLDSDNCKLSVNNNALDEWTYSNNYVGDPGLKQLGGINFFPATDNDLYYVDDIKICGSSLDMGDYISRRYSKYYDVGTTTVNLEIQDGSGNPASCSFNVTVSDNEPPVLLTQDTSLTLSNGTVTVTPADVIKESEWVGFINAFDPISNAIVNGGVTELADLTTTVDDIAGTVTLEPNYLTEYSNERVQASTYVEETELLDQFFTFSGFVLSNTLVSGYDNYAFVRLFDINFNLTYETRDPLVEGQSFNVVYDFTPATTVYVQYGFTVEGLSASSSPPGSLGSVVVQASTKLEDNCSATSISISPTSFDCSDIGPNTVNITVSDSNGNSRSGTAIVDVVGEIPSCSISSVPTSSVFTGGNPDDLYIGYGAASTVLTSSVSGGSAFTYSWSGDTSLLSADDVANPEFTPNAEGSYSYTLTVTNEFGCSSTCDITINVLDVRCGKKNNKVLVCHKGKQICISPNAVPAHLSNHSDDYLGSCDNNLQSRNANQGTSDIFTGGESEFGIYPNPSTGLVNIEFQLSAQSIMTLDVLSISGQVVYNETIDKGKGVQEHRIDLSNLASGIYLVRISGENDTFVKRLIIK